MKKKITFLIAAAVMLLTMFASPMRVWADVVTFTPGTNTGATSVTIGDITATMTTMNNASYYQIYANQSGTFSTSNGVITKIEFTCTASGTSKYGPGNASSTVGTYSYSGAVGTWTGSETSVTISSTAQVRMTSLEITYTPAGGGQTTYTVTYDCNGGTSGCPSNVTDITAGASITLAAAPTRTDYTFNGWSDGTTTYGAGDSYTVNGNATMTAQWQLDVDYLFYESFDDCNGTGGNDNQWSGSIANSTLNSDNDDWTFANGSGAYKCAKFGTTSKLGSAQTPAISHTGSATLTFKAAAWNGGSESTTLKLSATSGTLSTSTVTLVKGEWTNYTIDIAGITTSTQITFEGNATSNSRFFLDEVMVVEATPSTDPSILASDVNITYDAVSGSIAYTINNEPTPVGTLTANTSDSWLNLGTVTSTTVPFTCSANTDAAARTATVTLTYTYDAKASVTKDVTVTQAGNPDAPGTQNNPYTVAQARAAIDANSGITGVYATGIVSEIVEAYNSSYGNITYNISTDGSTTADQLQAYRGKSYNGDSFTSANDIQVGATVVIYGNLKKYNSTYEFDANNQLYSYIAPAIAAPTFSLAEGGYIGTQTVSLSCSTASSVIFYTTDGTEPTSASTNYNNTPITITETTTIKAISYVGTNYSPVATANYYIKSSANTYTVAQALAFGTYPTNNVFVSGIVSTAPTQDPTSDGQMSYYISDNGEATDQLYVFKGKGLNQAAFTAQDDIQVGDIVTIYGNVQEYQGTIEFGSGNYLVEFERPAAVPSITLPAYSFDVNADGGDNEIPVTYTNMPADPQAEVIFYESNGETVTTYGWITATINTNGNIDGHIDANEGEARSAYFKVKGIDANNNAIYSDLVTINQAAAAAGPSIVFTTTSIDIIAGGENRTMSFDYEGLGTSPTFSVNFYTATGEPTTYDWISGEITDGDKVTITVDANEGDARTAYFKVYGANSATNAESNVVTVNQAAGSTPTPGNWVLTDLADLTASDVFVIVGTYTVDNSSYAMSNDNGTANPPAAVEVTVSGNTLSGVIAENIQWNISGDATNGYTFYPNGDATTWLYITSSNAKCSVGTNASKTFVLDAETGYLKHVGTSKYIGIYNSTDWRGYNPLHANIEGETFAFYKKVDGPATPSISANDVVLAYNVTAGEIEYTINNPVSGGNLQAIPQTGGDLLTFGEIGESTIPFAFNEVNNTSTDKTVTVKLQYTYGSEEAYTIVTLTQTANPALLPSITVEPDLVEVDATGGDGELTVTYQNVETDIADIMWTDEFGAPAGDEPNWIALEINSDHNVEYIIDENIDDARMAYFVVYSLDSESNDIYSNVVTISQAGAVTPPVGDKYVKVTSTSDLTDGQYLIVYEEGNVAFDGSLDSFDKVENTIAVTIEDNAIASTADTDAAAFTIASMDEGYSIQGTSGKYITVTSYANGLATSDEAAANGIDFDNGNVLITVEFTGGTMTLKYNDASNQLRFRYYKSGQKDIQLYKKVDGPVTPSITANDVEIAYDVTSGAIEYTINNPYEGGSISAQVTTGGDWPLAISSISETSVNFTIPENESAEDRTGVIRLTYTYGRALVTKDVNVTQTGNPALVASITVNPDLVEVEAAGGDGTLTITVSNMTIEDPNADLAIEFYDGNGTTITAPDWIAFDDFEVSGENFTVYYMIDENTGELRQAFFKVYGMGDTDFVYSNLVTINQAAPVTPGTTGTIVFGKTSDNSSTPINAASVTGNDNLENTWTITTVGTTSFTNSNNVGYAQVGSGSAPATSITFTTTLPSSATITAFEAKFGGFSGTAGDITLKVDDTTVGQGSLNATEDVIVTNSSTATGTTLTVTVTNIAKGVKCYYISYTISTGSDPIIVAQNTINLSSTDTYGEFEYEVINPVPGTSLNATSTDSWISNIYVTGEKVTFTTTQNTSSTDDREGTITLSYEGATNKTVSVIQSKVDYATLPFAFDGGRADIETTVGLTQYDLDSDYGASPKLKFNTTGDWVVLKLNAGPASLSYDIKGNGFSGGTFDVEISVDGVTYTNIAQYTSFGSDVQPVTHIILDDNTRYVRWIYTEKSGGNVALGNIHASANYDIYGTLNIDSFDATMHPTTVHEKGIINAPGMVMSSQPDDLVIEDGGQVITNVEFMATLQKNISGYGDDPTVANGWYLISSPVVEPELETSAVAIGTYDLFAYEETTAYWWSNTGSHPFATLAQGVGYLYANAADQTLNFAGTMAGTNTEVEKEVTASCSYDNLKGYNLVGNPFTCNLGNGDIMIGATAITSVLVAEGGDDYVTVNLNDDGAVKPGQGFMVQTAAPATLTLNPGSSKGANSGFVRIVAGNENATDKAYINVANGNTLRKISLSDNTTQVYVMNDDKDYAAARVEELAGTMPVHFKAAEDGEYTITIEAVNADVEYMHLIDNFTGNDIDLLLESNYTFNATTNDSEARFRLDFGTYGVNEIAENNTFAYQYGNEIVVNGEGELQIFDLMGRMIMNTKINGVQSVNVPSNSVYILKLNNNIQKIVVK